MTIRTRSTAIAAGALVAFSLASCASTGDVVPAPSGSDETAVAVPMSACPEGFVAAYTAELAQYFREGLSVTEIPAADFRPALLAPFLDGGCAIRIVGTSLHGFKNDRDEGYALAADVAAIGDVLTAAGFVKLTDDPPTYTREDAGDSETVAIWDVHDPSAGPSAAQFFPAGTFLLS